MLDVTSDKTSGQCAAPGDVPHAVSIEMWLKIHSAVSRRNLHCKAETEHVCGAISELLVWDQLGASAIMARS